MMDNDDSIPAIAQVGWVKDSAWSTSTVYAFYEYGEDSSGLNPPMMIYPMTSASEYGLVDQYSVYTNGNKDVQFVIDGENYSPSGITLDWTANQDLWMGETHFPQDQTPGDTQHEVEFYNIGSLEAGVWTAQDAVAGRVNTTTYGAGSWSTGNSFEIWDTRYSTEG